jgi:hypothetical protein
VLTWAIREGAYGDETRLDDLVVALVLAWPGPIHEGDGHAVVYVDDRGNDAQRDALSLIARGDAGVGGPFEVFATTYAEPASVVVGAIELVREGRAARVRLGELASVDVEPLRDVMNDEPVECRWIKRTGFLWRDGDVITTRAARAKADGIGFAYEESWGVLSDVSYNVPWPTPAITRYDD